jgi:hypothetical protein
VVAFSGSFLPLRFVSLHELINFVDFLYMITEMIFLFNQFVVAALSLSLSLCLKGNAFEGCSTFIMI